MVLDTRIPRKLERRTICTWSKKRQLEERRSKLRTGTGCFNKSQFKSMVFCSSKKQGRKSKDKRKCSGRSYWRARNGLVDESVLGDDFTKPLTRMQASAIAVTLAEKLSGKSVSSAKSKTYSDTKSKYALKAAGAGIYGGASEGKFNPDGAVDRQQLATFFYQALMYAKRIKMSATHLMSQNWPGILTTQALQTGRKKQRRLWTLLDLLKAQAEQNSCRKKH